MKINIELKNLLYDNSIQIYNSYKNKYIFYSFSLKLNAGSFTIDYINQIPFNNTSHELPLPWNTIQKLDINSLVSAPTEGNERLIFKDSILKDVTKYFLVDKLDNKSFLNTIYINNKVYFVILFEVDNNGNVKNQEFLTKGLTFQLDIPENVTNVIVQDINLQSLPTNEDCSVVITNKPDFSLNI